MEDQPLILKTQSALLQEQTALAVVATALSAESALAALASVTVDVALVDLELPGLGGIDLIRRLGRTHPEVDCLVWTIFDDEEHARRALAAGARAYLLKGMPIDRIVEAIQDVRAGGTVVPPRLARALLSGPPAAEPSPGPSPGVLSGRELETLQLVARGLTNHETAEVLGVSIHTVRTHLEHVYRKLDVSNRVEAITEGFRLRLIDV